MYFSECYPSLPHRILSAKQNSHFQIFFRTPPGNPPTCSPTVYHHSPTKVLTKNLKSHEPFSRACLKNHSCNLHAPLCGIFYLHSVDVARYAALIQATSPTNCDAHLAESLFQTRSSRTIKLRPHRQAPKKSHNSPSPLVSANKQFSANKQRPNWDSLGEQHFVGS